MPKKYGYMTGGVKDTGGKDYGYNAGGEAINVSLSGAGMGNAYDSPNNKETAPQGGMSSSGTKSKSSGG